MNVLSMQQADRFGAALMALFGRANLPHRGTLSRFFAIDHYEDHRLPNAATLQVPGLEP